MEILKFTSLPTGSLRFRLAVFVSFVTIALCALVTATIMESYSEVRSVDVNRFRNEITLQTTYLSASIAQERGMGNTIIGGNSELKEDFKLLWSRSNSLFHVISKLVSDAQNQGLSTVDIDREYSKWQSTISALILAREQLIDADIASTDWLRLGNASVLATYELRDMVSLPSNGIEAITHYNTILIPGIATLSENAGRERAVLGNIIASGRMIPAEQKILLDSYRNQVDHSVRQIQLLKNNTTMTPELLRVINDFNKTFLQTYEVQRQSIYTASKEAEKNTNDINNQLDIIRKNILTGLSGVSEELDALVNSEHLAEPVAAIADGRQPDFSRTIKLFEDINDIHREYAQIRYIDPNGQERVRLDYSEGISQTIPDVQLQDKKGRYYFENAKGLSVNQLYVSSMDLNIENGKIEIPFKPMLRFAEPVFINGKAIGIIVLNLLAESFLKDIPNDVWLVDQDGYYLNHSDPNQEWGMMVDLGRQSFNLKQEYPEISQLGASGKQGIIYQKDAAYVVQPVYYHPHDTSKFWLLVKKSPPLSYPVSSEIWIKQATKAIASSILISQTMSDLAKKTLLDTEARANKWMALSVSLGIFLTVTLFLFFRDLAFVRRMTIAISTGLERLASNDLAHRIKINTNDSVDVENELTAIAMGINTMAESLDRSVHALENVNVTLEDKVKERTQELEAEIYIRKAAEKEMHKLTVAVEQNPATIIITDTDANIEYVNPMFSLTTGYSSEEVVGKNASMLKSGLDPIEKHEALWKDLVEGHIWKGTLHNKRKDGSIIVEETIITPISDTSGKVTHYLAIETDTTERLKLEHMLQHTQKMEAVGQLAGGIAHDFNNLLGIISGNIVMLQRKTELDEKNTKRVNTVLKSVDRAATLTRQLLGFTRKEAKSISTVNINDTVSGMDALIEQSAGKIVTVKTCLDDDLWLTDIDPNDLEDSLINLCVNAGHAMPDGGSLTIETSNTRLDVIDEKSDKKHEEDFVFLSVSDTGCGIPKENLNKIFEPFYSTKIKGKGTGLGLAMVFGFLRRSGGQVKVYSEEGIGTVFKLYLPRSKKHITYIRELEQQKDVLPLGTETILIVDDEADLVDVAKGYLSDAGYQVLVAYSGEEALSVLDNQSNDIKLVLSDVIMPGGMDGFDLAIKILEKWPNIRVALTSGFTSNAANSLKRNTSITGYLFSNLLSKPYTQKDLLQYVRRTLDVAMLIEWSDDMSVGISLLDDDHKILVSLLNRAYICRLDKKQSDKIIAILKELADYTIYHFTREEAIMVACDFPNLDNHRDEHARLAKQVNYYVEKAKSNFETDFVDEVFDFLRNWFIDHIVRMDKQILQYANKNKERVRKAIEALRQR